VLDDALPADRSVIGGTARERSILKP
jgi:hypothetical protein